MTTSPIVPKKVKHAIAEFKSRICQAIDGAKSDQNEIAETRAWKILLASDALIFWDAGERDQSKEATIANGFALMEEGYWNVAWSQVRAPSRSAGGKADE